MYMQRNTLIVGIFIILALVFLFVAQPQQKGAPATVVSTAPYTCDNGTFFVAETMSDTTLRVVIDGVIARTLVKEDVERVQYDDAQFSYVFEADRLIVADKEARTMTVCLPSSATTEAPLGFETATSTEPFDLATVAATQLVGAWRSVDDASFVRIFTPDGLMLDGYDDAEVSRDTYTVQTTKQGTISGDPFEDNAAYVVVAADEGPMHFKIIQATAERLELMYLEGNGILTFERITNPVE